MQSSTYIFVTNHHKGYVHEDAFNGELFVFPPGERVLVTAEAATHMLGFNLKDKSDVLSRLGKAFKLTDGDPRTRQVVDVSDEGARWLAQFEFTPVDMQPAKASVALAEAEPPVM